MKSLNILSQNRTEEIGYDLYERFVVPPFLNLINPAHSTKPSFYYGGRGSGKTMLLRYFCHETQFSKKRIFNDSEEISFIGLYWRMDSHYARSFFGRGYKEDFWYNAFEHYAVLNISIEIFKCLNSIKNSNLSALKDEDLYNFKSFENLKQYLKIIESDGSDISEKLFQSKQIFEIWLKNPDSENKPKFLPKNFFEELIKSLKSNFPFFENIIFHVFLDEYENLKEYQQILINTWIKHCERDTIIYNLALRPNGLKTNLTTSSERIIAIHDFRHHNLEEYFLEDNFLLFASEIFLNNLKLNNIKNIQIDNELIRDISRIDERKEDEYKSRIFNFMNTIFPFFSFKDIAEKTLKINSIEKNIIKKIQKIFDLRAIKKDVNSFVSNIRNPEIKIIIPYILSRKNVDLKSIENEIEKSNTGKINDFDGNGGYIHNIFVDCLLDLYEPYNRSCIIYSGFKKFEYLSHGNIRHFLELCYKCISQTKVDFNLFPFSIEPDDQALGINAASEYLLNEVKGFGESGNRLFMFVFRLGHLFSVNRRRPEKSRAEVIQFSILSGFSNNDQNVNSFIDEAIKNSILIASRGKQKYAQDDTDFIDYTLNPIYAPYFLISYRRKKKLDLSLEEMNTLIYGTIDEYKNLISDFSRKFESLEEPNLFENL